MRFIVDLHPVEERVEGTVALDGPGEPSPFSGWLELLRLLETHVAPPPVLPAPVARRAVR